MELVYRLEDIDDAARAVLASYNESYVWAFEGQMGAGKTTFIHALCSQLRTSGTFGSPTFSIINEYPSEHGLIFHIDLYRCRDEEEAIRAGVEECLYSGKRCFIEWPSKAPGIFPDGTLRLSITVEDENTRKIAIQTRKDGSS